MNDMLIVSELSNAAQTTPDAIRHYVRIGLLRPSRDPDNGYKLFNQDDVKRVRFIRRAKGLGFTLHDIQTIFEHSNQGRTPCSEVRHIIRHRIDINRTRLSELIQLQLRMEDALEKWEYMPDGDPDGDAICHLIESQN
jgi:DNA-binding transcriptional MerR regulator